MVRKPAADPLAHEVKAVDLRPGMITFIRTVDNDGNVRFTPDLIIRKEIDNDGCRNGIHFIAHSPNKARGDMQVCYWREAKVWAKDG
jgi:hypothetical protein